MSLTVSEIILPSAHFGGESTLPALYEMNNVQALTHSDLDEDDELFVGYGFIPSIFPYRMQDLYDRSTDPTALFLKAQIHRMQGDIATAATTAFNAYKLLPADLSLSRQAFALMLSARMHDEIIAAYESAADHIRADGRVSMLYAFALLREGKVDAAETVLMRDGGLSVTDIHEGEVSLTALCLEIAENRAKAEGKEFDPADVDVPRQFDFRMFVPKRKQ